MLFLTLAYERMSHCKAVNLWAFFRKSYQRKSRTCNFLKINKRVLFWYKKDKYLANRRRNFTNKAFLFVLEVNLYWFYCTIRLYFWKNWTCLNGIVLKSIVRPEEKTRLGLCFDRILLRREVIRGFLKVVIIFYSCIHFFYILFLFLSNNKNNFFFLKIWKKNKDFFFFLILNLIKTKIH